MRTPRVKMITKRVKAGGFKYTYVCNKYSKLPCPTIGEVYNAFYNGQIDWQHHVFISIFDVVKPRHLNKELRAQIKQVLLREGYYYKQHPRKVIIGVEGEDLPFQDVKE